VRISKTILVVLVATIVVAALPNASYPWTTVFEVRSGSGISAQDYTLQSMMDPQCTVTIGIEVMGVRIGYDSRHGFGALIEF
jgi:hypothetical protein